MDASVALMDAALPLDSLQSWLGADADADDDAPLDLAGFAASASDFAVFPSTLNNNNNNNSYSYSSSISSSSSGHAYPVNEFFTAQVMAVHNSSVATAAAASTTTAAAAAADAATVPVVGATDTTRRPTSASKSTPALTPEEEVRREKNRQKVRRHYYRKLNQLNTLRSEVATLEAQFQRLLALKESGEATSTTANAMIPQDAAATRLLAELESSKQALEKENEQLRQIFTRQADHFARLQELFLAERDLFLSSAMAKLIIKPFTKDECYRVRDKAVEDVLALIASAKQNPHMRRGAGVAGWQDEKSVEDGFFKFSLHKTFRNQNAEHLARVSFGMLTDPAVLARMYSAAVEAKCAVVQQVDDDNVVLFQEYRTMDAKDEFILMKSLFLVTRVPIDTGFLIIIRGLGEDRLEDKELFLPTSGAFANQVVWHDIFTWVQLERAGLYGEDCATNFTGSAPTVGSNVPFWAIEVLMLVLRWECAINGPPLLLKSSDDDSDPQSTRSPPMEIML
ncbi:hypothetical protein PINS_up006029 [Pythium insidiosum]|nr:hypothetical protein PINS_up006029 [Pythium insidiosum]